MSDSARRCDVLIIGGGMAGLACALELPRGLDVVLLSKTALPSGSTYLAQGGMAAAVSPADTIERHLDDTVRSGAGLVDRSVALRIISEGPRLVRRLLDWGVPLEGTGAGGSMEGGHSIRRVLHYKDSTGRFISNRLVDLCRQERRAEIIESAFAINLITNRTGCPQSSGPTTTGETCLGAYVLMDSRVVTFLAGETVLATGGAGKAYRYTSNDDTATGDGIAMAYRAGLPVRNMEFFQFHPTCLFHPDKRNFLITEALRGDGAKLLNLAGDRFMSKYDPERMELAPRDVVARAIDSEMKLHGNDHVLLDCTHLDEDALRSRYPQVTDGVMGVGILPWKQPIPVVPAAHYSVGGVSAAPDGGTDMPGLRAIGETSCTGFHGANRLGSNSLLEAGVMGLLSAESIARSRPRPFPGEVRDWYFGRAEPLEENVLVDHAWAALRSVMWDYVGIVRTVKRLLRAMRVVETIMREAEEDYWDLLPRVELLELRNLASVCSIVVESALERKESRGLHYNRDYPATLPEPSDTIIRKRP
ncbi:L-aspartate oxidase [Candidatus Fermentibacterales bacterium]|nr:L-aspartate oxidase [Candidatus Fermentibacterales bacterium]